MKKIEEKLKGKTGYLVVISFLCVFLCASLLHDLVLETDYSTLYHETLHERDSINTLLEIQKVETELYKNKSDSLYIVWSALNVDSLKLIINNKYDEKRNSINTLTNDELVRKLSDWLNAVPEEADTPR